MLIDDEGDLNMSIEGTSIEQVLSTVQCRISCNAGQRIKTREYKETIKLDNNTKVKENNVRNGKKLRNVYTRN